MIHCFRRFFARFIDYLLWGMFIVALLGEKVGDIYAPSWIFYLSFWLYVFVEAFLIAKFSTTFGKRLLGIRVFDENGKLLSFKASLKRAFLVFGAGTGFFLPYISLILPFYVMYHFLKYKTVFWDMVCRCRPQFVKTTLIDKLLLIAFIIFVSGGYILTARVAYVHREPDFAAIENNMMTIYFENIRPKMVDVLSEESVLTPVKAENTIRALKQVQKLIDEQKNELLLIKEGLRLEVEKMPLGEIRSIRQRQIDAFFFQWERFLFSESIRISLFENILNFFKSEENAQYQVIDGRPVFNDPELRRQYDNYMIQLQTFLSLPMS